VTDISDDAKRNRARWTQANAEHTDRSARKAWAAEAMTWGVFGVPEASLDTLGEVAGRDVVELGCGTAYVSAWLARRGARPVGVDVTPAQLATARRCQMEFGIDFPLIEASAEKVPLPSESFDLAVSEYGASIWCDPHLWIPEAHRLLRPRGRLWFLRNSTLAMLCATEDGPPTETLARPQRGLGRMEWPGEVGVEWQLPHGELFRLLRRTGFDVVDLVELYPPADATDHAYYGAFSVEWARKWPSEEIWVAEKAPELTPISDSSVVLKSGRVT
jgi:SAM-dependent methyltransferase